MLDLDLTLNDVLSWIEEAETWELEQLQSDIDLELDNRDDG